MIMSTNWLSDISIPGASFHAEPWKCFSQRNRESRDETPDRFFFVGISTTTFQSTGQSAGCRVHTHIVTLSISDHVWGGGGRKQVRYPGTASQIRAAKLNIYFRAVLAAWVCLYKWKQCHYGGQRLIKDAEMSAGKTAFIINKPTPTLMEWLYSVQNILFLVVCSLAQLSFSLCGPERVSNLTRSKLNDDSNKQELVFPETD